MKIYQPNEIIEFAEILDTAKIVRKNGKAWYNIACAFDIETSSFLRSNGKFDEKIAIMYEWTFGLDDKIMVGREWAELLKILNYINIRYTTEINLICYVHNLSYEMQFIRKRIKWDKVFSLDSRKPIYAISQLGIEFRCSYLLSGYSLSKVAEHLTKHEIEKMSGDLDYSLVRHSKTPLTEKEIQYCVNDVLIVMYYISEEIEKNGNITHIPLTKTGYVRNYVRDCVYKTNGRLNNRSTKYKQYKTLMKSLQLEIQEYKMLNRAFQGGFTHANPFYSNKILENVASFDFTSSYPTVMIAENGFPMSRGEKYICKDYKDFKKSLDLYACVFDIKFIGLKPKIIFENYISFSRCYGIKNPVLNNGRLVSCDECYTTITEQDFFIIERFYEWETIEIGTMYRYTRGYLPKSIVESILKLYENKTTLKGVEGKEVEYLSSKEMINSVYGMMVTAIVRDEIVYNDNDEWTTERGDFEKQIDKYNKSNKRFNFYPWGVWVTAFARKNLFSGILAMKTSDDDCISDYVYSDTDSIKIINYENHIDYIDKYNNYITEKLNRAMDHHGFSRRLTHPKTIKCIEKPLGIWDFECVYSRFKTLGAKRYIVEHDGDINITVSGLNKKICVPYLLKKYGTKVFENFDDELYIPPEYTGKNTHTYIDDEKIGDVVDYMGNVYSFHELSAVHLGASDYSLSLAYQYIEYLKNISYKM